MENIETIKSWLGNGSINVFGLPFSGKDTVGAKLAELFNGELLSSGMILRAAQNNDEELKKEMNSGVLADTTKFRDIVLPYFSLEKLKEKSLILSSVGRWEGEEDDVIEAAKGSGHEIKAVLLLNVSTDEIEKRRALALQNLDRGMRGDDANSEALQKRIKEFEEKTKPVIDHYRRLGLLIEIEANGSREEVFNNVLSELAKKIQH